MRYVIPLSFVLLSGCAELGLQPDPGPDDAETPPGSVEGPPPPPPSARTIEEFDTTTAAERVAAANPSSGGEKLGSTVASLGDATVPGFWIETPLVTEVRSGRLVYPVNGKSVEVELRPSGSGSSRVSLAALRILEAPLAGLPTLDVFAN